MTRQVVPLTRGVQGMLPLLWPQNVKRFVHALLCNFCAVLQLINAWKRLKPDTKFSRQTNYLSTWTTFNPALRE